MFNRKNDGNIANQIHRFTIDYGKFVLIGISERRKHGLQNHAIVIYKRESTLKALNQLGQIGNAEQL